MIHDGCFIVTLLLLIAGNARAIHCPLCRSMLMEFRSDQWHCNQCGTDSGAGCMLSQALGLRPVVTESGMVTPWGSAERARQALNAARVQAVPDNSNLILNSQQIAEIVSTLQRYHPGLSITLHQMNNALALAQLQILQLTHQTQLLIDHAERQHNLVLLVTYWLLQASLTFQMESQLILWQTQIINSRYTGGLKFLRRALLHASSSPELRRLFQNNNTRRYSMRHAATRLWLMSCGDYAMYQFGGGQGLVIIYLINDVYHIITPFNRVIRVTTPVGAARLLARLLQYRTFRQWLPDYAASAAMVFTGGFLTGTVIGLPMAVYGWLKGGLSAENVLKVLGIYGMFTGATAVMLGGGLCLSKPDPDIVDDLQ